MNNLTINQISFNFLAVKSSKPSYHGCNLAWITDRFYLAGNNYFIYTCSNCQAKQIKKGTKPKEVLNWGGQNV